MNQRLTHVLIEIHAVWNGSVSLDDLGVSAASLLRLGAVPNAEDAGFDGSFNFGFHLNFDILLRDA